MKLKMKKVEKKYKQNLLRKQEEIYGRNWEQEEIEKFLSRFQFLFCIVLA